MTNMKGVANKIQIRYNVVASSVQQSQALNELQWNPVLPHTVEVRHLTAHLNEKDAPSCFPCKGNCSINSPSYEGYKWSSAINSSS